MVEARTSINDKYASSAKSFVTSKYLITGGDSIMHGGSLLPEQQGNSSEGCNYDNILIWLYDLMYLE